MKLLIIVFPITFIFLPFLLFGQNNNASVPDTPANKKNASIWDNTTFLNAANFDFSKNISGSYLGKVNVYAPDIRKGPFGFNAGIMRIKFSNKDSSNSVYVVENKLMNPLDSIKHGNKYLRQFNQYTTSRSNTVWSVYFQPMIRIHPFPKWDNEKFKPNLIAPDGLYLHGHFELFVSRVNVTTTISHLQEEAALIDTNNRLIYKAFEKNPLIFDRSYLSGYFGGGITLNVDPFQNSRSRFFLQATIGKTNNYPNWTSQDIESTVVNVIPTRGGTTTAGNSARGGTADVVPIKSGGFYLVRAEILQLLGEGNSQIVLGTDIRGLLPKYNPLWATYIGVSVNLATLADTISGRKSGSDNSSATNTTAPTTSN